MQDIRKINDRLFVGRSQDGIPVEVILESRKDVGREAWSVYVDLRDSDRGSLFIEFTDTLDQGLELAGSLTDSDLPTGTRYTPVSELLQAEIYHDLAAYLSTLTNETLTNQSVGYQLGYLAAINDMRAKMHNITNSQEI